MLSLPDSNSNTVEESVALAQASDADFLVFYSSIDPTTKEMWCPDCRRVEELVQTSFDRIGSPSALIVFVGQRGEWKQNTPASPFRGEPWRLDSIPTIVRRRDDARLVDTDINTQNLAAFIGNAAE